MSRRFALSCPRRAAPAVLLAVVLAAGRLPAAPPVDPAPSPVAGDEERQAQAILDRWITAIGGPARIAHLQTMDYLCQFNYGPAVRPMAVHIRARADGAYRYDYDSSRIGRLTQAFDGRFTWQRNDTLGFGQLTADVHNSNLVGADFRAPLRVAAQFPRRRQLPDETIAGQRLQVVELGDNAGGRAKWYFDPATGLRRRLEWISRTGSLVVEHSDFREVQGVMEPFHIRRTGNGTSVEIVVQSITYNDDVDAELFAAPLGLVEDNQEIERILRDNRASLGTEALKKITTRRTKSRVVDTNSGVKSQRITLQKQPNLMVVQEETPGMGTMWQGYNGQVAWAWNELEGYRTMQGAELQQMIGGASLQGSLPLSALCPLRRLLEEKDDNGRRIIGIALASYQGVDGNFYFDTSTNDLVRIETFVQAGPDGQMKVVADMSDFRRVDGVRMPFQTVFANPAIRTVTTIESVEDNVPLDDALFAPKKDE